MTLRRADRLQIGDRFYVEPPGAERIPVQVMAWGQWGLVNGVMELPCRRLDRDDDAFVTVDIRYDATVDLVEPEQ